jgi:hypothetical protein
MGHDYDITTDDLVIGAHRVNITLAVRSTTAPIYVVIMSRHDDAVRYAL